MEETLVSFDNLFITKKGLTSSLIEEKDGDNINNNFFVNNFNEKKNNYMINTNSFISTKYNPDEFETFNFNRCSFRTTGNKNDNMNNNNYLVKSNGTANNDLNKMQSNSKTAPNAKFLGFSFINKSNENSNNYYKSFINLPIEDNKLTNELCPEADINYNDNLNVEYLQNLMDNKNRYNPENKYVNNHFSSTFDSNFGNFICLYFRFILYFAH